jgi:hypothetical protein
MVFRLILSLLASISGPRTKVMPLLTTYSDTFSPTQLGNAVFTTQPIQYNADFLFCTVLLTCLALDVTNDPF